MDLWLITGNFPKVALKINGFNIFISILIGILEAFIFYLMFFYEKPIKPKNYWKMYN